MLVRVFGDARLEVWVIQGLANRDALLRVERQQPPDEVKEVPICGVRRWYDFLYIREQFRKN